MRYSSHENAFLTVSTDGISQNSSRLVSLTMSSENDLNRKVWRSVLTIAISTSTKRIAHLLEELMNRRSHLANTFALVFGVCFVLVMTIVTAWGQAGTSTVRGVVKDPQGNVVAGATVSLTNSATNFSRTSTSTTDGVFSFEQIPVGDYRMEVTATGFKKAIVTTVHALVSRVTPVDVALEVGNVSETVTVISNAAENLINRDDGTLGNNFVNQQITQLPLEARSPLALLTLQPGVTKEGYVAGARTDQSNVTLDGVDINDAQTNAIAGVDAIPNGGAQ